MTLEFHGFRPLEGAAPPGFFEVPAGYAREAISLPEALVAEPAGAPAGAEGDGDLFYDATEAVERA